jgi:hypothetical protein
MSEPKHWVKCKRNAAGSYIYSDLTVGKLYEVTEEDKVQGLFRIINDHGLPIWFKASWFFEPADAPMKSSSTKALPRCVNCARELTPTLDAYYGTDPEAAKRCAPCRRHYRYT